MTLAPAQCTYLHLFWAGGRWCSLAAVVLSRCSTNHCGIQKRPVDMTASPDRSACHGWSNVRKVILYVCVCVCFDLHLKHCFQGLILKYYSNELCFSHFCSDPLFNCIQNYLREAWNIFDFVTVLGSITDILFTEIKVSSRDGHLCTGLLMEHRIIWRCVYIRAFSVLYVSVCVCVSATFSFSLWINESKTRPGRQEWKNVLRTTRTQTPPIQFDLKSVFFNIR